MIKPNVIEFRLCTSNDNVTVRPHTVKPRGAQSNLFIEHYKLCNNLCVSASMYILVLTRCSDCTYNVELSDTVRYMYHDN